MYPRVRLNVEFKRRADSRIGSMLRVFREHSESSEPVTSPGSEEGADSNLLATNRTDVCDGHVLAGLMRGYHVLAMKDVLFNGEMAGCADPLSVMFSLEF
jgi:hypothetical protein